MSKRFFDTELFNKVWFRKLKPKYKSFWFYVLCNCDIAGIWEADFEACQFFIGEQISEKDILEHFNKQLLKVDSKRYIIKDFVEFQNGTILNPKSPVHQKIINILEKYSLFDRVSNRVSYTHIVVVEVIEGVVVEGEEVVVEATEIKNLKSKPALTIPTEEEFLEYCQTEINDKYQPIEFSLKAKYKAWIEDGWKDGNGKPIKNWKTKILNTIPFLKPSFNHESKNGQISKIDAALDIHQKQIDRINAKYGVND